ncbi:putative calcium-activated chloride channel regulator 4-like, partial [Apostichopus japonicus]
CPTGWRLKYLKKVDNTEGEYRECEGDIHVGYENGCFTEAIWEQPRISGSIMQSVIFPEVTNFCDSDADDPSYLHNSEAPTKQNKFCDGRSSWDVMREHPDFNDGSFIGLVDFDDEGKALSDLQEILKRSNSDVGGSKIMLITDGEDGKKELTNSMKYEIIENKVIIDSIVISNSASTELENLAKETAPIYCCVVSGRRHRISKSVYIDSTLGRATVFDFTYFTTSRVAIDVRLTSPTGETFDQSSDEYHNDVSFRKVVIEINGIAEPGSWEYIIQNLATNEAHDVPISVSSYPSEEGVDPIIVDSYLSSSETDVKNNKPLVVYAEVRQGFYPVINANVIGIIDTPSGEAMELQLLDNGAGADVTKDDGIYSRYFTQFTGTGFYGFKLQVENQGSATVLKPGAWRFSGIKSYFDPEVLLAGNVSVYGNDTLALPGGPLPELVGEPAPNFTRGVSGGASSVPELPVGWTPDADAIPPSKITDLTVFNTSFDEGLVHVKFTAPGDDLDFGSAHQYIIRWSNSSVGLRKQQDFYQQLDQVDIILGNLSSPLPFGSPESIAFRISFPKDKETVSYLIGVYAIDEQKTGIHVKSRTSAFRQYIPPPLEDMISPTTEETTTLEKKMKTGRKR